jgi:drug/metabolite transporter (DMT)-like permease
MAKTKIGTPLGAGLIVLSSVFYASYGIWTKLMGDFFGGYTASAWRSVLVLAMLAPIALAYRQFEPVAWRRNWKYLVGLLLGSLFVWGPLYYAILHAGIGISLAVAYAFIVLGMFLFGRLMAGEQFTRDKWLATILGLAGVGLVFAPTMAGLGWLALVAAMVSGLSTAFNMVITKQVPYNATQSTVALWIASVIANFLMVPLAGEPAPATVWHVEWLYLIVFAAASVAASWFFVKGVKLVDAGAAGILGLLEIVFGVLFGAIFFAERPGGIVLIGVALIIAAAAVPYIKDYNVQRGTLDEAGT